MDDGAQTEPADWDLAAQPQDKAIELRDTVVPGILCKITPAGRKVFMLQYRTNAGERRKPALGQYGELTVDQARTMAQEWLAEVRKGGDPSAAKNAARKAPTMKEFCHTFMEDYSKQRNKPSTQRGYQGVIDRCIIPIMCQSASNSFQVSASKFFQLLRLI